LKRTKPFTDGMQHVLVHWDHTISETTIVFIRNYVGKLPVGRGRVSCLFFHRGFSLSTWPYNVTCSSLGEIIGTVLQLTQQQFTLAVMACELAGEGKGCAVPTVIMDLCIFPFFLFVLGPLLTLRNE
jgi:hypothetical protein